MAEDTFTPNLHLVRPPADRKNWTERMNSNMTLIDAAISTFVRFNDLQGAWANNQAYTAGQAVVDISTAVIYTALVSHISSSVPTTFAQERAAHPTYWSVAAAPAASRGAWATNTVYNRNDFVLANGVKYAFALVSHTSGSNFNADVALGRWEVVIDLSAVGSLVLPVLSGLADADKFTVTDSIGGSYQIVDGVTAMGMLAGVLPVAKGGTGTTSASGTGSVVKSIGSSLLTAFINTCTANTPAQNSNSEQVATTEYADRAVRAVRIKLTSWTSNDTWIPDPNMITAVLECVGGGGGGGGVVNSGGTATTAAGGGGAGAYAKTIVTAADVNMGGETVTVGAGGTAGSSAGGSGGVGGDTSIGTHCVADGGGAGFGVGSAPSVGNGGPGGLASNSTGDLCIEGGQGQGGAGRLDASGGACTGGMGGASCYGTGGRGGLNSVGVAGFTAGSGGGGASSAFAAGARAGGIGAVGIAIVTEYCYD